MRIRGRASDPRRALAEKLKTAGFWQGIPTDSQPSCVQQVAEGTSPDLTLKALGWWVDGESLAEGEVEDLLAAMQEELATNGVTLSITPGESPHDPNSAGYSIIINGRDLDLYRLDPNDHSLPLAEDPWTDCTVRPLARVNELLAESGADKRIIVFRPGANDGHALLASSKVCALLLADTFLSDAPVVP